MRVRNLSRRQLLVAAGAGLGAAGTAGMAAAGGAPTPAPEPPPPRPPREPREPEATAFAGRYQAGIATPAQQHLELAAFDLDHENAGALRDLLQRWSAAAAALTEGQPVPSAAVADGNADTGEAAGHGPARLTITFGLGPSLFALGGRDRLGLAARRPEALRDLPRFDGDSLEERWTGGDLCAQVCADDPQVAFHALHALTRVAHGTATPRWVQSGFLRPPRGGATPRNALGFKDGTRNIRGDDAAAMARDVWVGRDAAAPWMQDGTYLVVRRVRAILDVWDATSVGEQERVIGRHKASGAPLGRRHEHDPVDPSAMPADAHARLASPEANEGARMLRRGFNYHAGVDRDTGQLDTGLVFIAFQRDPARQFVPIQRRLASSDALNKHVLHTGSAVFACPPGARPGAFVGSSLFA